jgi:hypothetical protein
MSVDQLWSLHKMIAIELARKMTAEKERLDQRLRELRLVDTSKMRANGQRPYPKVRPKYRNPERSASSPFASSATYSRMRSRTTGARGSPAIGRRSMSFFEELRKGFPFHSVDVRSDRKFTIKPVGGDRGAASTTRTSDFAPTSASTCRGKLQSENAASGRVLA